MDEGPTSAIRLSVSIVLYNSPIELLLRTLDSLSASASIAKQMLPLSDVTIHIVDNSPEEADRSQAWNAVQTWATVEQLTVKYLETGTNRGFGVGHNLVSQSVDTDYHLILNPDAEIAPSTLGIGISCLEEEDGIVMLSPRVLRDDAAQEFLCKRYPSVLILLLRAFAPRFVRRLFRRRLHRYEMRDVCTGEEESEVMLASGCFMLVRTEALRAAGGFDERFFVYFEDFDLSLRLGGMGRVVYHPAMKIVHHGGYTARKGLWHMKLFIKSGIQFFNLHGWRWI